MASTQNKLVALISWCLSVAGLTWQMYFILEQYFRYPTATKIIFDVPEVLIAPSLYFVVNINHTMYKHVGVEIVRHAMKFYEFFPFEEDIIASKFRKYMRISAVSKSVGYSYVMYEIRPNVTKLENEKSKFYMSVKFNLSSDLWP